MITLQTAKSRGKNASKDFTPLQIYTYNTLYNTNADKQTLCTY